MWPVISAIGLAIVLLVNYLANSLPLNDQQTGDVANTYLVPFQPAGWVFGTIWPLIYLLVGVYVVASFVPATRDHIRINAVGPFLLLANSANIAWLFVWHWEHLLLALFALLGLVAALMAIYFRAREPRPNDREASTLHRLIATVPFSVYLGWACVASIANIFILASQWGWDEGVMSPTAWTMIFMAIGVMIATRFATRWHDGILPLVIAYAYAGIAARHWDNDSLLAYAAIAFGVISLLVGVMAIILSTREDAGRHADIPGPGQMDEGTARTTR